LLTLAPMARAELNLESDSRPERRAEDGPPPLPAVLPGLPPERRRSIRRRTRSRIAERGAAAAPRTFKVTRRRGSEVGTAPSGPERDTAAGSIGESTQADEAALELDTSPGSLERGEALLTLEESVSLTSAREASRRGEPSTAARREARAAIEALRNDESVVAEAVALRRHPLLRAFEAAGSALGVLTEELPARLRLFLNPGRRVRARSRRASLLGRIDGLPPALRRWVVAAPYVVALLLASLALYLSVRPSRSVAIAPAPLAPTVEPAGAGAELDVAARTAVLAAASPEPSLVAPGIEPAPVEASAPVAVSAAATAEPTPVVAAPAPAAEPEPAEPAATVEDGARRVLPMRSSLRVRPHVRAPRGARLKVGDEVSIFASLPAPRGWVVARAADGTLGYLVAAHLEGRRDPELSPAPRKARKVRRSGSSSRRRSRRRGLAPMPL
jgi:hypothetical protein